MSETIQLEIVSSTELPFKLNIKELYIPAYMGETGILENHKPYVSLLEPGEVSYLDAQGKRSYLFVGDGFVEVLDNKVVLISDTVEQGKSLKAEEIDSGLAEIEKEIKYFSGKEMTDAEMQEAPDKLEKAFARQKEYIIKAAIIKKQTTNK